ncbi:MAG: c-type cytochrome [Oceanicoccus sp.]|uniref:c-type cytochrome n=1 Tax=Oceanicoccus sp. TaxID=2691044 RepID=UPI00263670A4|nr:c-type cytochrome [Oceanicoccus sp.]MCP3907134.1 c-type cytochrome [Oceanicoccus sp.]MDG1772489.1 c-type cytochrome [Oceanicoccus sp.]
MYPSTLIKLLLILPLLVFGLSGCERGGVASGKGFSLPSGSLATGKAVFLSFNCLACHTIKDVEDPFINNPALKKDINPPIQLGGYVDKPITYAELLTSIINPSHKLAKTYKPEEGDDSDLSPMRNYNDVLTVTELIDLVAFLESHYELEPYQAYRYRTYPRYPY